MHFTKMHGLGNDYLYVYGEVPENIESLCISLSDRHFGAGSDGMIYINKSDEADFSMCIFNADGSEAMMCGNGIRCVGKYVYDKGYTDKTDISVSTLSGIKKLHLSVAFGKVKSVDVDMGKTLVEGDSEVNACGKSITLTKVNVGNPHAVIFCEDAEKEDIEKLGKAVESLFKGGINVEFVSLVSENEVRMRVWERGSGITLACGTGACAAAAAAIAKGICFGSNPVKVNLDGGSLLIKIDKDGSCTMSGPAAFVYEGDTEIC